MADQKTTDAAVSSAVNTFYEKKILQDFEPKTVWYSQAPVKTTIPKGEGKTVEFTRYVKITPKAADDTDEFSATQTYLSATVITATIRQKSEYVKLSRLLSLTAISDPLTQAVNKLQMAASKALDKMVRNDIACVVADVANLTSVKSYNLAIDGGTLNSTGITARIWSKDYQGAAAGFPIYHNKTLVSNGSLVTSVAKTGLTLKSLQHGVSVLHSADVAPRSNGMYGFICHPEAAYQLATSTGFKGWIQYTSDQAPADANKMVQNIAGVDVFQTTMGLKYALSGDTLATSSGSLYASLLFGDEAYGSVDLAESGAKGFNFYLKEDKTNSNTSDPCSLQKTAGYSITACGRVLNSDAGLWIVSTSVI